MKVERSGSAAGRELQRGDVITETGRGERGTAMPCGEQVRSPEEEKRRQKNK